MSIYCIICVKYNFNSYLMLVTIILFQIILNDFPNYIVL